MGRGACQAVYCGETALHFILTCVCPVVKVLVYCYLLSTSYWWRCSCRYLTRRKLSLLTLHPSVVLLRNSGSFLITPASDHLLDCWAWPLFSLCCRCFTSTFYTMKHYCKYHHRSVPFLLYRFVTYSSIFVFPLFFSHLGSPFMELGGFKHKSSTSSHVA